MVALPAVDEDQPVRVSMGPFMKKKKKKSAMTTLFNKMAIKASYSKQDTHEHYSNKPVQSSGEEEDDYDYDDDDKLREESENFLTRPIYSPAGTLTTSPYSLTSGPLIGSRRMRRSAQPFPASSSSSERSRNHHLLTSAPSSSPAPSSCISSSPSPSLCKEQQHHIPLSHHHHLKPLLSQLASSISASKTTFALLRASSTACTSLEYVHSQAEKAMAEELQTLSDLHMGLHSLSQQLDFGMKQYETSGDHEGSMRLDGGNAERQEAMLKSYEGIISRFHDEIRKKNATMEALKETLAKSMLNGEKLERRIRDLEGKLFPVQPS